jgi:hypothetical protein
VRRALAVVSLLVVIAGCATPQPSPRTQSDAELFAPVSMRVHPIFSGVKDWTGDGKPDGLEALLEFQDRFGDPTKASGTVIFELFSYSPRDPDPRSERVCNPWLGSLQTLADQQARWNRTSRTYLFQLEYPQVSEQKSYVLTATFDTGTTRYFDRVVLEGKPRPRQIPSNLPPPPTPPPSATRPTTPLTSGG